MQSAAEILRGRALLTVLLASGLFLWSAAPWLPFLSRSTPRTIVLYGFSILEPVLKRSVFPAFQKRWRTDTGEDVELVGSFGPSGIVTNQLLMGVPAELAILSTGLEAERLGKAGVVRPGSWRELPHGGVLGRTPFVILVRPGNPKSIRDYADLCRPGVKIVHPDPLTSGAASWTIVAEYGAGARQPGGGPDAGRAMLLGIWRNVVSQAESARAAKTQFDEGFGDALVTYEQDALASRARGGRPFEIVTPRRTILSEHTLVVPVPKGAPGQQALVKSFADFLFAEEAQRLFVREGFRSLDDSLNGANRELGTVEDPFLITDFGGWTEAKREIIDRVWRDGVMKELRR